MTTISSLQIVSSLDSIVTVSDSTRHVAESLELSQTEIYEVELVVVEAVTNCIKYACEYKADNYIKVDYQVDSDILSIVIEDGGKPWEDFDKVSKRKSPFDFSLEDLDSIPESGMGLALLHQIMDHVSYQRVEGKNILTLKKSLSNN